MIKMTLSEIANLLDSATATSDTEIFGISTDTRTLIPQNLYIAIKGEQFDGHDFVEGALNKLAGAACVSHKMTTAIPQLIVADPVAALGQITAHWRNRFTLPLIGVTGSNGKTTLKNMIASILQAACEDPSQVLATEGNLNNNIGVPLMLARLNDKHRYGVIEMGMNHFGEIDYLTHLVKPHVAIINNAAAAHLEGLEDISGVARAKGEIFAGLDTDGIAILNKDDPFYDYWQGLANKHKQITFGLKNPADISATLSDSPTISLHTPQGDIDVTLPLLGEHNVMNALAATAATLALDISLTAIKQGLENVKPAPGRLRQHILSNGTKLIDDTYNANPASVVAAINTLAALPGTHILILGDMKELGENAQQLHAEIGKKAHDAGIEYLFTLGELSQGAAKTFGKNAQHFTERTDLLAALQSHLQADVTILIKGSRSMHMEKVVAGLLPQNEINETEHTH
jgi:UDP-N-acetylmuramoyl-tripeptide--D-alanyl-D-alanine ligase